MPEPSSPDRVAFTAEVLWSLPRVGAPAAGGEEVVVPVTTHETGEASCRLWRLDLGGGGHRPLTAPAAGATKPAVSPDGATVAFLRKVDGRNQVHLLPLDGGEAERATDLPLGAHGAVWAPDGSWLLVVADLLVGHLDVEATAEEVARRQEDRVTAHVTENAVYRYWDTWLTGGEVTHLFRLDPATGALRDLTPASRRWMRWPNTADPVADVAVSPDGGEVAFCADVSEPPHRQVVWTLHVLDLESGVETRLTDDVQASRPRYSPDGDTLVFGLQRQLDFYADRVRVAAVPGRRGGERPVSVLTEDWDRSADGWEFLPDGDLVLVAEDDGRQPLFRLPLEGRPQEVARDATLSTPAVTASGRVLAVRASIGSPPEVVEVSPGGIERVTCFTREVMDGVDLGDVEEVRVEGADGETVQAFVVHPPGGGEGALPLVHSIHGGPHAVSGDGWHWRWNPLAFAAPGYRVALVNFHGSTSWGDAFTRSILGEWGPRPAADVEAVTDHLVARGLADPDRLAITGGSYGGYLVAWLTSQTDRYACAVAHAAVTDFAGMYASDITSGRRLAYGAELFDDRDRVDRWNPAAHAAGYATPTLVIHGDRDYRVPVGQGLALYGILRAKGVAARLVHYPDENHWILSPANSLHWYGEVLGWLERHLGG